MKLGNAELELDEIDLGILSILQENCRVSLSKIGEQVGLSPPSVVERVKKLEDGGIIRSYHAILDSRLLGMDVTAFIGVYINHPQFIDRFEGEIDAIEDVLECHHVTGAHTVLLKVKTRNTSTLESLISRIRSIEGVEKTETMVVLSTHSERTELALPSPEPASPVTTTATPIEKKARRTGRTTTRIAS